MTPSFEKWEGSGNDFVLVEGGPVTGDTARHLCDRRLGVGADGVLAIGESAGGFAMVVVNADGSRPEMCGNGLRCVAAWLATRGRIPESTWTTIATDAGPRPVFVTREGSGFSVAIRMGQAMFQPDLEVVHDGARLVFRRCSMGNPHAVCFGPGADELEALGPKVAAAVEGGVNAELVRGGGKRFDVLVWERGVGPTMACGTGACAVAAIACRDGRAPFDEAIVVALPGGALEIEVARETFDVTMRGPARRVFSGQLERAPEQVA